MIFYILCFVLVLFFGILMFMCRKTLSWPNLVIMLLTFMASLFALQSAVMAFKHRTAWLDRVEKNEEVVAIQSKEVRELKYGPDNSLEFPLDSLNGISNSLTIARQGTGRTWTGGLVENQDGNAAVSFSSSDGTGASQLDQDMTVYAFGETSAQVDENSAPFAVATLFVGIFQVTGIAGDSATLRPVFVTTEGEVELATPQSSWTLYEKMPLDQRDAFKRHAGIDPDSLDLDEYRNLLMTQYLPAERFGMDAESAAYEKLIDVFAFDGMQMSEINTWISRQPNRKTEFDPRQEDLWVNIRFSKASQPFQVDGSGNLNDGAIDTLGRAIDQSLKAGEDVRFGVTEEEIVLLPKVPAVLGYDRSDGTREPSLVELQDCERVGGDNADIYYRPLRNYPHLLVQTTQKIADFELEKQKITEVSAVTELASTNANNQIRTRTTLTQNLQTDQEGYTRDLDEVSRLRAIEEANVETLRGQIRTSRLQILELYKSLSERPSNASTEPTQHSGRFVDRDN